MGNACVHSARPPARPARAGNMFNNTPIWTSKAVGVTPFTDACMTEGRVMLHDGCVDKPTPDTFTCEVRTVRTYSSDGAQRVDNLWA